MSQRNVQLIIGRLVTDEELRRQFLHAPADTLVGLSERGWDLTNCEIEALLETDVQLWGRIAVRLPSRLQCCSLLRGAMTRIDIQTRDGICPSYVFRPSGDGPWPAVLVYMDGVGIRPAMLDLAARLSTYGYFVLLPDYYYRSGSYAPMDGDRTFADPEKRKILMEKFIAIATPGNVMSDTQACLDYLASEPDARPGPIGTTGYCLGGFMSLTAAGTYPDRIAATASFHGGRLATDDPRSPHLLAPQIKSKVYIAGATDDASFTDADKARLENALTIAGVDHRIETYPARHGWVMPDFSVYDRASAERHWRALVALLDDTLKDPSGRA
jgi:carboxymethylenebutenolidase